MEEEERKGKKRENDRWTPLARFLIPLLKNETNTKQDRPALKTETGPSHPWVSQSKIQPNSSLLQISVFSWYYIAVVLQRKVNQLVACQCTAILNVHCQCAFHSNLSRARENASVCMNNSQHCGSYVISLTATLPVQQIISTRLHWRKCLIHNSNLSLSRTIP